ncbi:MAG: hypothetical protein CEE38_23535 [Planctomycetes bacterium B3_Pla]|nr:MAG: hypothetical protein CEE38_23535 [Planctomycetes bacterium B3_Pla]
MKTLTVFLILCGIAIECDSTMKGFLSFFKRGKVAGPMSFGHLSIVVEKDQLERHFVKTEDLIWRALVKVKSMRRKEGLTMNTWYVRQYDRFMHNQERRRKLISLLFKDGRIQTEREPRGIFGIALGSAALGLGLYDLAEIEKLKYTQRNQGLLLHREEVEIIALNKSMTALITVVERRDLEKDLEISLSRHDTMMDQLESVVFGMMEGFVPTRLLDLANLELTMEKIRKGATSMGLNAPTLQEVLTFPTTNHRNATTICLIIPIPLTTKFFDLYILHLPALLLLNDTMVLQVQPETQFVGVLENQMIFLDDLILCD